MWMFGKNWRSKISSIAFASSVLRPEPRAPGRIIPTFHQFVRSVVLFQRSMRPEGSLGTDKLLIQQ